MTDLFDDVIDLLKQLIATPSFSKEETETADLIQEYFEKKSIATERHMNNIWTVNKHFDADKPTLLLNSHHDTVQPNSDYTKDPFEPAVENDKLFGLGSNDAGGPLVALLTTFLHFYRQKDLGYNLVLALTAEEEISGENGISSILDKLPSLDCAIVGEPTQMQMAVAEKGLMVLDCTAKGRSGHAARKEGENAIYKAIKDIEWLKNHQFDRVSDFLGPIRMTTTLISAGTKHNVVPNTCSFTVDVRTTDAYSNTETLEMIKANTQAEIIPRSTRLNPSSIPSDHPLVTAGKKMGIEQFGSPTLSDQALLPVPSLKMGPGKSSRSHTADEFIRLDEIKEGIKTYIKLLDLVIS